MCASHHRADAAVLGLGAAGGLGGRLRRAVVVGAVSRVGGVCRVASVAVLCVRVTLVGRLLAVRGGRVELVWRVLQVGRRVVVVVVVVRRGVLGHVAELGVVGVHGDWCVRLDPGRVVQVCGVRGVGDEGGVWGLRRGAGGLHAPCAEQRSEQRRGVGQGLATVAGRAVSAGGGSPSHVRTANDGPLQETGQSEHRGHKGSLLFTIQGKSLNITAVGSNLRTFMDTKVTCQILHTAEPTVKPATADLKSHTISCVVLWKSVSISFRTSLPLFVNPC